jgi:cytidylate kinase
MREEKLKEIKEREKTTMRRLRESVGHDASDYAIMSIASELAGIQREVTILEYESWKLKT